MLLYCFIALNLQKIYLSAAMTGFVCNVGFDLLFIPSYGPLGAAMGTLIGDAACLLALLLGNYLIKVDLGVGVERLSPRIEP
jgi:Na+-driven multidrug efflux pump